LLHVGFDTPFTENVQGYSTNKHGEYMKFLIAGLGSIGRRHFRNLIALGEKDIILLRTRKATLPDDELAGYPVETDIHDALNKHNPDAVRESNCIAS